MRAFQKQRIQGLFRGVPSEARSRSLIEHRKIRIDLGGNRVFLKEPGTKAVDGGNPRAFDGFAMLGLACKPADEALFDFRGSLFRKRDRQDARGAHVVEVDQPEESLNQNTSLAGAWDPATTQTS